MRVVVTLTTLPDRYNLLYQTLISLNNQTVKPDQIYLTLPYKAVRLNKEYPPLPENINKLCTVVKSNIDYGPMTKLYGALIKEENKDTIIITIDDDIIYPPNFIEVFLNKHQLKPDCCITGTGILIGNGVNLFAINTTIKTLTPFNSIIGFNIKGYRKVDIVQGFSGVLYKRQFFPSIKKLDKLFNLPLTDDYLFKSDDVVLSGYLCKQRIKRVTFNNMPQIKMAISNDALAGDPIKMLRTFKKAVKKMNAYFIKYEKVDVMESPVIKIPLLIFIIIFFVFLLFCLLQIYKCYYCQHYN